jgi:uncharacterized protein (TIGR03083 family)
MSAGGMRENTAFAAEAANLSAALQAVTEAEFDLPTRCPPWTVRALLAHVGMATDRVILMLAEPAPPVADTDAAGYYRPDVRFSPATNRERVDGAVAAAARNGTGAALAARFARTWRDAHAAVAREDPDRVVRTRHGDAMRLADFMVTRVVELVVHGLDLADALHRPPWTDDGALAVVTDLLVPDRSWTGDPMVLVRAATGRADDGGMSADRLRSAGVTWLALG